MNLNHFVFRFVWTCKYVTIKISSKKYSQLTNLSILYEQWWRHNKYHITILCVSEYIYFLCVINIMDCNQNLKCSYFLCRSLRPKCNTKDGGKGTNPVWVIDQYDVHDAPVNCRPTFFASFFHNFTPNDNLFLVLRWKFRWNHHFLRKCKSQLKFISNDDKNCTVFRKL